MIVFTNMILLCKVLYCIVNTNKLKTVLLIIVVVIVVEMLHDFVVVEYHRVDCILYFRCPWLSVSLKKENTELV